MGNNRCNFPEKNADAKTARKTTAIFGFKRRNQLCCEAFSFGWFAKFFFLP